MCRWEHQQHERLKQKDEEGEKKQTNEKGNVVLSLHWFYLNEKPSVHETLSLYFITYNGIRITFPSNIKHIHLYYVSLGIWALALTYFFPLFTIYICLSVRLTVSQFRERECEGDQALKSYVCLISVIMLAFISTYSVCACACTKMNDLCVH